MDTLAQGVGDWSENPDFPPPMLVDDDTINPNNKTSNGNKSKPTNENDGVNTSPDSLSTSAKSGLPTTAAKAGDRRAKCKYAVNVGKAKDDELSQLTKNKSKFNQAKTNWPGETGSRLVAAGV